MKLDKNQLIGIALIALMFIGFQIWGPKNTESATSDKKEVVSDESSKSKSEDIKEEVTTSAAIDSNSAKIPARVITVKNNDVEFKVSTEGALFYDFKLENFLLHDSTAHVVLLGKDRVNSKILLNGSNLSDKNLRYKTNTGSVVDATKEAQTIILTALINGQEVSQKLVVPSSGFLFEHQIYGTALSGANELGFQSKYSLPVTERRHHKYEAFKFPRTYADINFDTKEGDFDDIGTGADENEEIEESLKWYSFKQRFFTVGYAPENGIEARARFTSKYNESDDELDYVKKMSSDYTVKLNNSKEFNSKFYVGPNDFYTLKQTGIENFQKNVDMGWTIFGVINTYIILPVFDWLADALPGNFGLVIFLLVLLIKTILFPIAYKSYSSMAKMKALKPDLEKLKEKHGEDQQAYGQAQMGLYRQAGVNPVAGCLPQLLQMPFLFALFRFFPNAIQLRQESFLWAKDLSTYDALISWNSWIPFVGIHVSIFTILMTATTLINSWYNGQNNTTPGNNPAANQMKYLMYFMPLIFFFVLNDYPSGLTYYYFISTLFTILQQFVANKMINPDKIRAKIDSNKQKSASGTAKKSRFQQRLETAMEAQEAAKKKKK